VTTPPRAEVKNECSYTSAPPIYPRGPYSDVSFCPTFLSCATPSQNPLCISEKKQKKKKKKNWCNINKHSRQPEARCTSCGYFRKTNRLYLHLAPSLACGSSLPQHDVAYTAAGKFTISKYKSYPIRSLHGYILHWSGGQFVTATNILLTVSRPCTFVI